MTEDGGESDAIKRIYGQTPEHVVPSPSPMVDFMPWHLPRKQWIRRKQWQAQVARLYRDGGIGNDRPFRYMSLPGNDLIDVSVIAETCLSKSTNIRYLGFNLGLARDQAKIGLAEQVVRSKGGVNERSKTINFDVLCLSGEKSGAWRHVREFESFDAINLDICDSFADRPTKSSHLAVKNLLEYQLNRRRQPWLLFITTAADVPSVPDDDLNNYISLFQQNLSADSRFKTALNECVILSSKNDDIDLSALFSPANNSDFAKLLTVGIGKWLASCLSGNDWNVQLTSAVSYRRGLVTAEPEKIPEYPELVSLAFLLKPPRETVADSTPFSRDTSRGETHEDPGTDQAEVSAAIRMLGKVSNILDLDVFLQSDEQSSLRKELTVQTAGLLRELNYDELKYREWTSSVTRL